nr:hypothetical protein [Tanacetum cinerariifolium]
MDKGVADTVKNHKRHDDDDDDDKDPSAGPNEGKKTKSRRTKESKSSKKPSTTKEASRGKAPSKSSKTGKFASAKEPVEEPITVVVMDDVVNTAGEDVVRDDINHKTPQNPRHTRPQTKIALVQQMVFATKDHVTFNDLMATPISFSKYVLNQLKIDNLTQDLLLRPAYSLLKGTCTSNIKTEYNFQEYFNALTDKLDWNNLEGDHYPFDVSKHLPLHGIKHWGERRKLWYKSQLYKFKQGDFIDLHLNDIEDMLLLADQHKLLHLNDSEIVDLIVALVCSQEDSSSKDVSRIYNMK